MCLNRFILRSDMELELTSLIPDRFDGDFVAYLLEVGRVKPQLIDRPTIQYVVKHREQIERLPHGSEVLTAAAAAALRIRSHLPSTAALCWIMPTRCRRTGCAGFNSLRQNARTRIPSCSNACGKR